MNKKLIIVLIVITIIGVIGTGIFLIKKTGNNNENENFAKEPKYIDKYKFLEKEESLGIFDGTIIDIKETKTNTLVCTKNKVYIHERYNEWKEIIKSDKNIESIFFVNDDEIIILKNSDNSYSTYGKVEYIEEEYEFLYKELDGIDVKNMISAKLQGSKDEDVYEIFVINKEKNKYYANFYKLDENNNVKTKELKLPISFWIRSKQQEIKNIKEIFYSETGNELYVIENDGTVYGDTYDGGAFYKTEEGEIKVEFKCYDKLLVDVNKIYSSDILSDNTRPIFEKIEDKNNLYTYREQSSNNKNRLPNDEDRITLTLPNKYTTNDIKNIMVQDNLLIEFNDNSVYITQEEKPSELVYNEEISSLYKNGNIKKIILYQSYCRVLMDDNCVYEIDL